MREISLNSNGYIGYIRTSDEVAPAFGNNFIDIEFVQESLFPDNVTLKYSTLLISLPLHVSMLSPSHMDGVYFNLEWLKFYAPKSEAKNITIDIYADNTKIASVPFLLTAGRGEVEPNPEIYHGYEDYFVNQHVMMSHTQITKHWNILEALGTSKEIKQSSQGVVATYRGFRGAGLKVNDEIKAKFHSLQLTEDGEVYVFYGSGSISGNIAKRNIKSNTCHDIEIRITDRYGLRGVMGGNVIDSSEGGDDVKYEFNNYSLPYRGVYQHQKIGQKIQKEVFFDCEGDKGLLSLLRDACVYGVCEWYDEVTSQWLPCEVVDSSLDTDPFKEQSITFILQQL